MTEKPEVRSCAVCGCTEDNACVDDIRGACHWISETLCSHCAQPDARRSIALIAGERLADVAAELIRFAREGEQAAWAPFINEPAENTAEALRTILQIELTGAHSEEANQMLGAIDRFLDGWA